jgi:hypothetical protein
LRLLHFFAAKPPARGRRDKPRQRTFKPGKSGRKKAQKAQNEKEALGG